MSVSENTRAWKKKCYEKLLLFIKFDNIENMMKIKILKTIMNFFFFNKYFENKIEKEEKLC